MRAAATKAAIVIPAIAPFERPELVRLGASFDEYGIGIELGVVVMILVTTAPLTVTTWADVTTEGVGVVVETWIGTGFGGACEDDTALDEGGGADEDAGAGEEASLVAAVVGG